MLVSVFFCRSAFSSSSIKSSTVCATLALSSLDDLNVDGSHPPCAPEKNASAQGPASHHRWEARHPTECGTEGSTPASEAGIQRWKSCES